MKHVEKHVKHVEKHVEHVEKHVEHVETYVEHAEKHVEHAEKHVEHAGTGKRPLTPSSQTKQQHNVNSAGTSLLMAENKAMGSSLLF